MKNETSFKFRTPLIIIVAAIFIFSLATHNDILLSASYIFCGLIILSSLHKNVLGKQNIAVNYVSAFMLIIMGVLKIIETVLLRK